MSLALSRRCDRLEEFERLCRERVFSLTIQRRTVLEALLDGKDHPTAEEVHANVQHRIPGLSLTTVYRVLDALVGLGVICKVYQPGGPFLFDTRTHPHQHLACLSCNRIFNLEEKVPEAPVVQHTQDPCFEISETYMFHRGTCGECLRKRDRPRAGGKTSVKQSDTKRTRSIETGHSKKRRGYK